MIWWMHAVGEGKWFGGWGHRTYLTLKQRGNYFQFVILFSLVVQYEHGFLCNKNSIAIPYECNNLIRNYSNTMHIRSALWILMAWCFSTRASVTTVLNTQPCVSSCLRINSLVPGRCGNDLESVMVKHILVRNGWINNTAALVQIMTLHWTGYKLYPNQ